MIIQRGYKVKLYPTKLQVQQLLQIAGAYRWVYNHFLERKRTVYEESGENLSYGDLSKELTILRKEINWLADVQLQSLQQSLRQLDVAYRNFFRRVKKGIGKPGFPSFKNKYGRQSIKKVTGWSVNNSRINFTKDMNLRYRGKFPEERQGTLTLSRDAAGQWWASAQGFEEREEPELSGAIGIDLGLHHLAITSDGDKYSNLKSMNNSMANLRFLSKGLSRKKKGSRNRYKAKIALARFHRKVANRRLNHLHHVSKAITDKNHAVIAHENLAVVNMMKNHRLARHISDASWGEFIRQITYKQVWKGGEVVKIDRFFPSSKTCSACGFILQSLPLNVRKWDCPKCNSHHDRDMNAAINIKQGAARLGVEGTENSPGPAGVMVTGPVKHEVSIAR